MTTLELNYQQTRKFWEESCDAVEWDMMALDIYLKDKYTIVKRQWTNSKCLKLTFVDEQYKTWLILYL
mgnify:FL=1